MIIKSTFSLYDFEKGSLVAELFKSYIDAYIGEYKAYELFQVSNLKGQVRSWELEDMLNKSTVKYFAERKDSKKAAMALVQGGRAKNEIPTMIKQEGVIADIDLSGAYVSILWFMDNMKALRSP